MNKCKDYRVTIIFLWLIGLTIFLLCDKMNMGERISKVIILPPPLEAVDNIGGFDYE